MCGSILPFKIDVLSTNLAIVGSSDILLNQQFGPHIDTYTDVIRFNRAPTVGFETSVGSRTTLRVMNVNTFKCKPSDPPDDDMFASRLMSSRICVYPWDPKENPLHPSNQIYLLNLSSLSLPPSPMPTSGMAIIHVCVSAGLIPHIFGFETNVQRIRRHYWNHYIIPPSTCHSFQDEASTLLRLAQEGKIILHGA